jgi:hypothetical protein
MPVDLVARPTQYPRPIVVVHGSENTRFRPSSKTRKNHATLQIPAQSRIFEAGFAGRYLPQDSFNDVGCHIEPVKAL